MASVGKRDKEGHPRPFEHKMRREQFGDQTVGDMNGIGSRRFDPDEWPMDDWRVFAKDQFVDTGAAIGPTLADRVRGERALKHTKD